MPIKSKIGINCVKCYKIDYLFCYSVKGIQPKPQLFINFKKN